MTHAVFISNPESFWDDHPGRRYHFPNRLYLSKVTQPLGDWVIFYQSRRGGAAGYHKVQRVIAVEPDPKDPSASYALLDPASQLDFEQNVPRLRSEGQPYETGLPLSRGSNSSSVRLISKTVFSAILSAGLSPIADADAIPRHGPLPQTRAHPSGQDGFGLRDAGLTFDPAPLRPQILTSRAFRDQVFARIVKRAYRGRRAMTGLALRNGGGRPEVEAAHILPVAHRGPDTITNGIALSGTVHWMFDRGLVSVGSEGQILVTKDPETQTMAARLLLPDRRVLLPSDVASRPHASYFTWHRETIFKG